MGEGRVSKTIGSCWRNRFIAAREFSTGFFAGNFRFGRKVRPLEPELDWRRVCYRTKRTRSLPVASSGCSQAEGRCSSDAQEVARP